MILANASWVLRLVWDSGKSVLAEAEVLSLLPHYRVSVWVLEVWLPGICPEDKAHITRTAEGKADYSRVLLSYKPELSSECPDLVGGRNPTSLYGHLQPLISMLSKPRYTFAVLHSTRIYRSFDTFTDFSFFLKYSSETRISWFFFTFSITRCFQISLSSVLTAKIRSCSGLRPWTSFLFSYTFCIVDLLFPCLLIWPIPWLSPHVHLCSKPAVCISDCLPEITTSIFHRSLMLRESKIDL